MTEKINAQISAFVDDELPEQECSLLVKRMCADDNLQHRISRFALIGDVIRGDHHAARADLSKSISKALEDDLIEQMPTTKSSSWKRWAKPFSGVAVAATVAGVSLLALQNSNNDQLAPLPDAGIASVGDAGANALSPVEIPRFVLPDVRAVSVMPQSRMDQYLLRHRGVATSLGGVTIMGVREIGSDQLGKSGAQELPTDASALKEGSPQ